MRTEIDCLMLGSFLLNKKNQAGIKKYVNRQKVLD
jgi:hypothetical protein